MGPVLPACRDGSNRMTVPEPLWRLPAPDVHWIVPPPVALAVEPSTQAPTEPARRPVLTKPLQVCLSMLVSLLTFPLFGCFGRRRGRFLHCQLVQILRRDKVGGDLERCIDRSTHYLLLLVRPLDFHVGNADYSRIETQSGKEPAEIVIRSGNIH